MQILDYIFIHNGIMYSIDGLIQHAKTRVAYK